jgi:hypothetical protein
VPRRPYGCLQRLISALRALIDPKLAPYAATRLA